MESLASKLIIHEKNPHEEVWNQRELDARDRKTIERDAKEELPEDVSALFSILEKSAREVIERYRATYPFLKAFGEFSPGGNALFDEMALKKIVLAYRERLQKRGRVEDIANQEVVAQLKYAIEYYMAETYAAHITAYTGVFEDLDELNFNQEVFIGRDGVYMYYAREAQRLAREGQSADTLSRHVILLDYPTNFIHTLTPNESKEYLHDHGITDVSNTVFIDTGYSGSVPEHILRHVFNVQDDAEVDKRIVLISSTLNNNRQSKGVQRRGGGGAAVVEESPKPHQKSDGVYRNTKAKKLESFALPETPEALLMHDVIQFMVMRHFYQQGLYESGR